jgi:hypothetical protein
LRHPKPRGSACEAQLFRDRDKELEMAIFHVPASLCGLRLNYTEKKSWTHRPPRSYDQRRGDRVRSSADTSLGKARRTVLASCR